MPYPPDIARRRRQLGLPVTPAEHVRYEAGETLDPPITRADMARTLRAVATRAAPPVRVIFLEVAARLEAGAPVARATRRAGPLGQIIDRILRDPGEEG